ncbi:extended synaptotagmin-2-B isoform X2 [Halyomorpha halys]|uniref:extended synaptotagmin-2-B isoform X2 n=1 Tax=Halyomorpha halys TaxID=286706 RepID=UPI0006D4D373|nr:extended synaptotagmin-2-B isoform X2 [Halyomorpha halys]
MSELPNTKPTDEGGENQIVAKPTGAQTSILHLMYTFGKHLSKVAIVYLFGYFNISPAWLLGPLVLSVLREEWKKEKELKRNIAKAAALSNEKDVILARVDDLPAWVFFPDIERAEWVNRILNQVWPNVNHYAKDIIKDKIEPAVQESLLMYNMKGFSFQKMRLGSIPPRVGGVKVYDKNIARDEIIMDLDIFYAGDCDISFTLSGLSGGIKDFQIHGMIRIVMKPLIKTMPLIGGLQIYFLNNPTMDFNLVGVADLLDMPGLSDMLRRIIVEQVSAIMVLPNKLSIVLSDDVSTHNLKFPEPQGVLRVHLIEAKELMKKDISMLGKGKSDPYAIITLGAESYRTKTIDNTVDPKWDFWCEFPIDAISGQILNLRLMDEDDLSKKDSNLGKATVEVFGVSEKGQTDSWITLEEAKTGMVHIRMSWLEFSDKIEDLKAAIAETQMLRVTTMSTAVLMVYVDSASHLPRSGGKSGNAPPDPVFHISVGKVTKQSQIIYRTEHPVFEKEFTFLVNNPETDTMHIKFTDTKTQTEIGKLSYNLSNLLDKPGLELQHQPLLLKSSVPDSKVQLSLRLRVLKHPEGPIKDEVSLYKGEINPSPQLSRDASLKKQDSVSALKKQDSVSTLKKQDSVSTISTKSEENLPDNFRSEESQLMTNPSSELETIHRRQPSTTSSVGENYLGKIQLTLRFSVARQRLIILVHKIANLPLKDPSNIPDPYVKLYLLPERSKDSKRKTETVKDNCNPVYDETFEYVISQGELSTRQLEVTVLTQKTWKSPVMGQVIINLAELDLNTAVTAWYDLQPEALKEKDQ